MQHRGFSSRWPRPALLSGLLVLFAGCESTGVVMQEADLARVDQCVLVQASQSARLDAQHEQLDALVARLEDRDQLRGRIDALARQIAELPRSVVECPEPDGRSDADSDPAPSMDGKRVIGEIETVRFEDLGVDLRARIDTGANTSSIDARDIQPFERDGERWVRFSILAPDDGEPIRVERPRSRRVRIIQSAAEEAESRPVVDMRVSIGDATYVEEFTLADRSNLTLPALIGRNILRDLMVVDVSLVDAARLPPRSQGRSDRNADDGEDDGGVHAGEAERGSDADADADADAGADADAVTEDSGEAARR